eukprot:scaffold9085_cov215-Amphora_coffeaeformis.AAC.19
MEVFNPCVITDEIFFYASSLKIVGWESFIVVVSGMVWYLQRASFFAKERRQRHKIIITASVTFTFLTTRHSHTMIITPPPPHMSPLKRPAQQRNPIWGIESKMSELPPPLDATASVTGSEDFSEDEHVDTSCIPTLSTTARTTHNIDKLEDELEEDDYYQHDLSTCSQQGVPVSSHKAGGGGGGGEEGSISATLHMVSGSQVETLLCNLTRHVSACMKRKNELYHDIRTSFAKARARYVSGGTASALVSMRRVAKLRIALARVAACRCALMEIFVQVKAEFQQDEDTTSSHHDDDDMEEEEEEESDDESDDDMSDTCHYGDDNYAQQPQLIDLELDFFRSAMEQAVQGIHAPRQVEKTDEELLQELV